MICLCCCFFLICWLDFCQFFQQLSISSYGNDCLIPTTNFDWIFRCSGSAFDPKLWHCSAKASPGSTSDAVREEHMPHNTCNSFHILSNQTWNHPDHGIKHHTSLWVPNLTYFGTTCFQICSLTGIGVVNLESVWRRTPLVSPCHCKPPASVLLCTRTADRSHKRHMIANTCK